MSDQLQPTVLRCSSLAGWTDCERRSAARLFWREIVRAGYRLRSTGRSIGALIGTAVHKAAAVTLDEKAASGSLPSVTVATDCAHETLRDEMLRAGEIIYDGTRGVSHSMKDAQHQVVTMSAAYHRVVAPSVRPLAVERRLEAEVSPDLILSGSPDLVAIEPGQVRDLKTGVRPPSAGPQLGGYSLLISANRLTDIQSASIDFVQRVRTNKAQPDPVVRPVELAYAETAAISIIRRIATGITVFRNGDAARNIRPNDSWAFTANPSSVLCSAKYCPCYGQRGPTSFCNEWQEK
jgi:hypothetical protein